MVAQFDGSRIAAAGLLLASIVLLHAIVLAAGSARAQDDAIAVATLIPYAEKAEVRDSIRQDCGLSSKLSKSIIARSVKKDISMIRLANPNDAALSQGQGNSDLEGSTGRHRTLALRITDAIQTSGGLLPTHSLSIDGVYKEEGRIVGTFVATRFARASFFPFRRGECAILSEATRLLAKDVVRWTKKPNLDSRLGDAR